MKRFLSSLFIISFCFIIVASCLEFLFKNTPNYIKDNFIELKSNNSFEVLLLGNSHIQALGHAIINGSESFNFGVAGQDIYHMHVILEHTLLKLKKKNLKQVIIGLDYDLLGYSYKSANTMWLDRLYYPVTGKLSDNSFGSIMMAKSNFFRANRDFSKLTKVRQTIKNQDLNYLDFSPCYKRAEEHSVTKFDKSQINKNVKLLVDIYFLCERHKIKLTLINLPKANCYYRFYDKEVAFNCKKAIMHIVNSKGILFYDFWESDDFNDTMFFDNDHLNKHGVNKIIENLEAKK